MFAGAVIDNLNQNPIDLIDLEAGIAENSENDENDEGNQAYFMEAINENREVNLRMCMAHLIF